MAQQINQPNFTLPAGPFSFAIDGIATTSAGVEIILEESSDFSALGRVFEATIQTRASAGAPLEPWHTFWLDGGPAFNKDGTPITRRRWVFGWPGTYVGLTREEQKKTDFVVDGTAFRAFTSPRLIVRPVTVIA